MARIRTSVMAPARGQRGFTMLEILVTLFLVTMWLLGTAGVQSSSLKLNLAAQLRTQAVFLATDIAERMQANQAAAVAGLYAYAGDGSAVMVVNCVTAPCSSENLAAFDLAEWSARVTAALPNSSVTLTPDAAGANPVTYTIVINWADRRDDGATSGSTEAFSYTATRTIFNPPS